jgi:hypothetical protein
VPYEQNARTHSEEQIGQLARSIEEWGFTVPVLIDEDDGIIAGHGRIVLADNKLTENGGWDNDLLQAEIGALKALDFDISLTKPINGRLRIAGCDECNAPLAGWLTRSKARKGQQRSAIK